MARVKITFPATHLFETETEIRISDINYGGHLGNDAVLSLVHEARIRFLSRFGYSEKDIEGKGIIMTDAAIVYKSEAFYGEKIKILLAVDDISNIGFDLLYKIVRVEGNKEIALVKTGIAFFDYLNKRITSVPQAFIENMKK
jgi:acyl-CoA thioester hydrolase